MRHIYKLGLIILGGFLFLVIFGLYTYRISKTSTLIADRQLPTGIKNATDAQSEAGNPVTRNPLLGQQKNASSQGLLLQGGGEPLKIYNNFPYDFSFTYPASLGDVVGEIKPAGTFGSAAGCQSTGSLFYGTFSRNPHIDFGYITSDFHTCRQVAASLFETLKFYVSGKQLRLYSWKQSAQSVAVVTVEEIIPVDSPHDIRAYIFKNIVETDSNGEPAAIVQSPTHQIGDLVFRIHYGSGPDAINYDQGIKLLETVIKK